MDILKNANAIAFNPLRYVDIFIYTKINETGNQVLSYTLHESVSLVGTLIKNVQETPRLIILLLSS